MVTFPTYCEINSALITYKQITCINHKQHQHDSPTNMTPRRNNLCFKYWLANDMHKSQIRSTQHPQVNKCLHLGPSSILEWTSQRIICFQIFFFFLKNPFTLYCILVVYTYHVNYCKPNIEHDKTH